MSKDAQVRIGVQRKLILRQRADLKAQADVIAKQAQLNQMLRRLVDSGERQHEALAECLQIDLEFLENVRDRLGQWLDANGPDPFLQRGLEAVSTYVSKTLPILGNLRDGVEQRKKRRRENLEF